MGFFKKRDPDNYEGENLVEEIYGRRAEEEISEMEFYAERVEAYEQMRNKKRRKGIARAAGVISLLVILTSVVLYIGYRFLFIISEINIVGDSPYSDTEICEGAGVSIGDALFSFSSVKAEERLMSALPYIGSLDTDRKIPDKITFTVEYEEPVYYTEIYGETYLISGTLRLLGEAGNADLSNLTWLRLTGVKVAELGAEPILRDSTAEKLFYSVTEFVEKSALNGRITQIDLRDLYSLTMVCDNKYLLEFGEYTEIDTKLRIADAVLKDDMFKNENKARINLTKLSETTVAVDNQLDFTK